MNQDERMQAILDGIESKIALEPVPLDAEMSEANSFLKILRVRCFNWRGNPFEKVHALRFKASYPALDALNMIIYPKLSLDAPIYLFFCLVTKRKVIFHVNLNAPFDDETYRARWIEPVERLAASMPSFLTKDRYPEWMEAYRQKFTIYGLFPGARLDDLTEYAEKILSYYVKELASAVPVRDRERLDRIAAFHKNFRTDIRTRDKAQAMMAKFIGKSKAHRIFYEVAT